MARGAPSFITICEGGREGGWSECSKSSLRESSGQLVLMQAIHAPLHHMRAQAGGVQVVVGVPFSPP